MKKPSLQNAARDVVTVDTGRQFSYDASGRLVAATGSANVMLETNSNDGLFSKTVSPSGTIYRTVYDGQGRMVSTWVGTHDTPTTGYWSPTNLTGTDMAETAAFVYDGGGVGDSNLTKVTDFTGSAAAPDRATQYAYDWRDRRVGEKDGVTSTETDGAHRPLTVTAYDNLDEVTQTQAYDGDGLSLADGNGTLQVPAAGKLRSQATASYDELGQVYRTTAYSVDPATGNVAAGNLASNYWYDKRGNLIESSVPNGPVAKSAYDGAGRLTLAYATDGAGGTGYAAASSVGNDTVLSQVAYAYDADGNVILTTSRDRLPNASGTGALGNAAGGVLARVSYAAAYYDGGDRLTASVDVGTNGGTAWTRPSSAPGRSGTVLVTGYAYGADGTVQDVTDPRGIVSHTLYDALGRKTLSVEDYGTGLLNKTTLFGYGPAGMTSLTAVNAGHANQTTAWAYGVTTATGSKMASNDVVGATEHPDPTTGNASASLKDTVTLDMQGDLLTTTDRNGTVHAYGYDSLGRQVSDSATTLGTGIDGAVRKIATAYDGQGHAYLTTSYDGSGNVTNQVERLYNGFGQLTREYQSASGSVSLSTTPSVQYTYSTGSNNSRLTGVVYPDGYAVGYNYASGVDGNVSRLTSLTSGSVTLQGYTYLGLGTVVERNHPSTGANLSYITVGGTGDAGDSVTGLDRFGRVVDQKWANGNTTLAEYKYGYDANGNALYKQDAVNGNFSQLFVYDNLNQLSSYQEGTLNANHTALVGNSTANQTWGYDALGNWQSVTTNGTTQTRTANAQDEYTAVGSASPAYDAAGDMITDETGKQFAYDAWGRLVAVKNSGNATLETNTYDGLGRRITTTAGGTTTTLTYSAQWQVLEESVGGNFTRRYVWSPVYVDALLFLDSDTSGTGLTAAGTGYTRLWPMQDANWDVAALGDASGAVVERYDYTPFGIVTIYSLAYTIRTSSTYNWKYEFQGLQFDGLTGLYDARNRELSPSLGRPIVSDRLQFSAQETNFYRWEGNSPVFSTDPSGLFVNIFFAAVGGGVGAVLGAGIAASRGENVWRGAAIGGSTGAVGGFTFGLGLAAGASLAGAAGITAGGGTTASLAGAATVAASGAAAGQTSRIAGNLLLDKDTFSGIGNPEDMAVDAGLSLGAFRLTAQYRQIPPSNLCELGAFGKSSWGIPSTGPKTTKSQRIAIAKEGACRGCHSCGGNPGLPPFGLNRLSPFNGDHQPPTSLANGLSQMLFPQCWKCSIDQGVALRQGRTVVLPNHIWNGRWHKGYWIQINELVSDMPEE